MDFHQAAEEFLRTVKYINKTDVMARFNLYSHGELLVLVYLYHQQGHPILPSEISKYAKTSAARVAAILNTLEEKGYITRAIDLEDRRKILVTITEAGKAHAIREKESTIARVQAILKEMGEEDATAFIRTLRRFFELGATLNEKEKNEREATHASKNN